jgi:hypothetical protein
MRADASPAAKPGRRDRFVLQGRAERDRTMTSRAAREQRHHLSQGTSSNRIHRRRSCRIRLARGPEALYRGIYPDGRLHRGIYPDGRLYRGIYPDGAYTGASMATGGAGSPMMPT